MSAPTVVLDACVLYPAQVRSFFLYLAGGDLYRPRWTDDIHAEWMRNLLADRPGFTREQAERIRTLMDAHVPDCLVAGYEGIVPTLDLPDADDRHVLAAAIHAGASAVVTFNLTDFPADKLAPHRVAAVHPDEFVLRLLAESPDQVCAAVARHRASLKKPPKTVDEFLTIIAAGGLPLTAAALRTLADAL